MIRFQDSRIPRFQDSKIPRFQIPDSMFYSLPYSLVDDKDRNFAFMTAFYNHLNLKLLHACNVLTT